MQNWKELRQILSISWIIATAAATALAFLWWGAQGAALTLGASVYLGLGFFLTENLIGLLTKVKVANPTGAVMVMSGKMLWIAGLFFLSRKVPAGAELPLACGMLACLVALTAAGLKHYGLPKVSDAP